uniref:START domain-containing protein n=1 Tax=uncultured Thiotrichaceae bacterium TaxID=298394 RepID=A0A6S6SP82_9GAMM|nr:MAG: Unknown protein [uncultured Thiotrichaceae bacterium]
MKFKGLSFALLLFSLCLTNTTLQAAGGWREIINESGIVLSQRTLPGRTYQQIQGQMTISGRIDTLTSILNNPALCSQWLNGCRSSQVVKKLSQAERINYTVIDAPFPLEDRDMYVRSKAGYDSHTKTVTITLQGIHNFAAEQGKRVRVMSLNGFWKFKQLDNEQVKVSYQMHSDPQITPPSVVDSFSPSSLLKTFTRLRKLATSPAHRNIRFTPAELQSITTR